ncbi:PepSY domain-containing protein [Fusobacterium simiae]|uniref:PepSY domain-containing protein n=1 Tax=Fusobacterium simiae TaxID=855 RepID=A0ABT4DJH8_FUSSI|nr:MULTISPECIES: PepSY domain-containing protein [Fusobacterium]MCY7008756.1 PepSY domain-containing protein [Fusobacterium simiae]
MKKIKNIGLLLFLMLSTFSFSYQVNYDDAVDIVLRNYPQSRVTKIEVANYRGKIVYEGEAFDKGQKIEFIIDVNTGEVFKIGPDYDDGYNPNYNLPITFEEANRIALDNSYNGTVKSIELKNINKRAYYVVEVRENKSEKEIDIDANSGKVLSIKENI